MAEPLAPYYIAAPGTPYQAGTGGPDGSNATLSSFGLWTSIAGAALSAVGNFYAVKSQQYALESQALSAEFQQSMSAINARAAEQDAQAITEAGKSQQSRVSAQYGQAKGAARAATAGRGIQGGYGSAAEVQASIELAKQLDMNTIDTNTVRAANAARTQAVDARNQSLLAGVSAANLRGTAGSLDPFAAGATSLLSSASGVSQQWLARARYRDRARF